MTDDTHQGSRISCYIRTFNEETNIGRTVTAARLVAHEVVVVDSGSTDGTVTAAESAGARVIRQTWLGNGHQKRVGEEACRHDWLLDLDADEVVSKELAEEIAVLFKNREPNTGVCSILLTTVDPTGRIWRKSRPPRRAKLYHRTRFRMPAHGAWDQLQIPRKVPVYKLKNAILHYGLTNIAHLSRKQGDAINRRLRYVRSRSRFSTACRVYLCFPLYFAKRYFMRGLWREGPYGFMCALVGAYNHWLRDASLYEAHVVGADPKRQSAASQRTRG